jgi:transcriptional regulator GlxA family with amidase domain
MKGRFMKMAFFTAPGTLLMDMAPAHTLCSLIPNAEVYTVWKKKEAIFAEPGGFSFLPTTTFEECPRELDVLFVPAVGPETHCDEESLDFLADRGSRAKYVASVCAGALMLGAAGLLNGYRTSTHWAFDDVLPKFGATTTTERVVVDRNRITSDGGSAAFEHALVMAKHLVGDEFAKEFELMFEWDPQAKFAYGTGSPTKAGVELTNRVKSRLEPMSAAIRKFLDHAIDRLERKGIIL